MQKSFAPKTASINAYPSCRYNLRTPVHFDLKLDLDVMMMKSIRRLIAKKWTNYTRINRAAVNGDAPVY